MSIDRRSHAIAEHWFEQSFFASRWILAPIYLGLAFGLATLTVVFVKQLVKEVPAVMMGGQPDDAVLLSLSLVDLALTGNLLLTVIFSGSRLFFSEINNKTRPSAWLNKLDFSVLKFRLIASIVAISGIGLLREFMELAEDTSEVDFRRLGWMIALHFTFVTSGILLAGMQRMAENGKPNGPHGGELRQ